MYKLHFDNFLINEHDDDDDAQNCIIFSAKLMFFFWGQAPRPQLGRAQPLPRPHPFNLLNIYPPLLT